MCNPKQDPGKTEAHGRLCWLIILSKSGSNFRISTVIIAGDIKLLEHVWGSMMRPQGAFVVMVRYFKIPTLFTRKLPVKFDVTNGIMSLTIEYLSDLQAFL